MRRKRLRAQPFTVPQRAPRAVHADQEFHPRQAWPENPGQKHCGMDLATILRGPRRRPLCPQRVIHGLELVKVNVKR